MNRYQSTTRNIEQIVREHEALVRRVAHHMHGRVGSVVEFDDLLQVGFIGLIQAAQRYTVQEGVTFANYAVLRIRGAMYDHLRKNSNLCRNSIRMQQRARQVTDQLRRSLQREPTQRELAIALDLTDAELADWQATFATNFTRSLDETYDEYSTWFAADDPTVEQTLDRDKLRKKLVEGLKQLPEREALVLQLYYVEEFNIYEIASTLSVSPGRVSQIKSSAFRHLREAMDGVEIDDVL